MSGNYIIQGVRGFDFDTYIKAMKVRFGKLEVMKRTAGVHLEADPKKTFIEEHWDDIIPLTVEEAFLEQNQEKRRVLFSCLGPERIFKAVEPTLIDRQVLKLKNQTWNDKGKLEIKEIEDVYELYELDYEKLISRNGDGITWRASWRANLRDIKIKVVRCWCTTTGREYWIFVRNTILTGLFESGGPWELGGTQTPITDAIQAIAWTFRVGIPREDIEAIYRQGDCLVVKAKNDAQLLPETQWYHLDKDTYISKLVAQS